MSKWVILIIACLAIVQAPKALAISFGNESSGHTTQLKHQELKFVHLDQRTVLPGFQSRTVFGPSKEVLPRVWVDNVELDFISYAGNMVDFVGRGVTVRMRAPQNRSAPITVTVGGVKQRQALVSIGLYWQGSADVPYGV